MLRKLFKTIIPGGDKIEIGKGGEDLAVKLLKGKGYKIVGRNYRTRLGEVDIIAKDGETVVFVEVKTRATAAYGTAKEAVGYTKKKRFIAAAKDYIARHGLSESPARFDVVSIDVEAGRAATEHIVDAFESEEQ